MFTYKNKVIGAVVTTYGKVNGADWIQVKDKPKAATADKDDKKGQDDE